MARAVAAQGEHAFKSIARDVKAGEIPSLVLLCGKEQYLVHWAVKLISDKYVNEATRMLDLAEFDSDTASVDAVTEACETLSMFSEKRVVIVYDFPLAVSAKSKGYTESDEARFAEYAKGIPESTVLVITCEKPEKKGNLYKACEKYGKVYDFGTLAEGDLRNFIVKRFSKAGRTCKPQVISEIISGSGYYDKESDYTLFNMDNDLSKIIAHADSEEITIADVREVISSNIETYIFDFIDSMTGGNKDTAYRMLFSMLGDGESVFRILALVVSQLELILDAKEIGEEGMGRADIMRITGAKEYPVKKAQNLAGRCSTEKLRNLLAAAYDTDKNIKNGILGQEAALEMLIAAF